MSHPGQPAPHSIPRDTQSSRLRGKPMRLAGAIGWRRVGTLLLAFFLVMVLSAALSTTALLWYGQQSVDRVTVPGLTGGTQEAAAGSPEPFTETLNVLLVGNDSRKNLTDEQLQQLGTRTAEGMLTDTIMLVQLNPRNDGAAILSFPRDLLVTRCDGSRGRINAAYAIGERTGTGGPSCLVETVTDLTGIGVDNYVEVDFAGFIDVVNSLGGVTLHLDQPLEDRYAGLDLPAGCVSLDGTEALSFVRARHLDNDFGRIARQQRFIRELVDETLSADTLLNVGRLPSLVQSATDAVAVDSQLSLSQMRRLANSLRGASAEGLTTRTVPSVQRRIEGAAYVVPKEEEAERLFSAFASGEVTAGDSGPASRRGPGSQAQEPAVSVSDVPPLKLLNGVGVDGLAAEAADVLEEHGFEVDDTANADDFDVDRTRVVHSSMAEEAEVVAEVLDDPVIEEEGSVDELTIVLGSDFSLDELREAVEDHDREADSSDDSTSSASGDEGGSEGSDSGSDEPQYAGAQPSATEEC